MKTSITVNQELLIELRKIKGQLQQKSDMKVTYEDVVRFLLTKASGGKQK